MHRVTYDRTRQRHHTIDVTSLLDCTLLTFELLLLLQFLRAVLSLQIAVVRVLDAPPQRGQPLTQRRVAYARARHHHHNVDAAVTEYCKNGQRIYNNDWNSLYSNFKVLCIIACSDII